MHCIVDKGVRSIVVCGSTSRLTRLVSGLNFLLSLYIRNHFHRQIHRPLCRGRFIIAHNSRWISYWPMFLAKSETFPSSYSTRVSSLESSSTKTAFHLQIPRQLHPPDRTPRCHREISQKVHTGEHSLQLLKYTTGRSQRESYFVSFSFNLDRLAK